ncbi:EF-hand domain-containing protein [Pelagibius sp. Alg239-R121]|uniref:EF-hand domain-containing protein n=1 Tax=Pelagibius sp. Alg239-R121 TaxID=2993448 RepID=UPI0024A6B674|nr:hypothetical protein [Pelagibius sp. Alg239-R121]
MKKRTKLAIGAAGLAATIALTGVGLSNAHDRWSGSESYRSGGAGYGHEGHGKHGGRHGKGHKMMRRMMEQFDANEDRSLTQAEIDQGRAEQLAKFDSDKDGKLSLQEFEALWLEMSRSRMVDRFQNLDEDGDAEVTSGEYLEPFANMVERHDRNGDGTLSKDDRRKKAWRSGNNRDSKRSEAE